MNPDNLNPTAAQLLLSWRFDPLVWLIAAALIGVYYWQFAKSRRDAEARRLWRPWRAVLFGLGAFVALFSLQSEASSYTLNSMALYMGRLMLLAELAPPLLILGLPRRLITLGAKDGVLGRALAFLLDPFVAAALWITIIVFWNLPVGFNASLVSATAGSLLPLLYLFGGTLAWAVALNPLPKLSPLGVGGRGWFGFLASLPMMGVAAVWLYSPTVLYSPYVNVPCLWNLTPLQNQQISGWVMMVAGIPAMAVAIGQLFLWIVKIADANDGTPYEETVQSLRDGS